jgi:phytoene dehydrogenase-like protein
MATVQRGGRYDAIIIGGGHNGLITAAYLGRAGKRVCVLERRGVLGGCACTETPWPGFRISTGAYVLSLLEPRIIRELKLKEHGLQILPRNPSSFTPQLDGPGLLLGPDREANRREIAYFSPADAERYQPYQDWLERLAEQLEPVLEGPAPDLPWLPSGWRRKRWSERLRDLWSWRRAGQLTGRLAGDLAGHLKLLTGAAAPILEQWFESEPLRATLATDAVIGAWAPPSSPGTAYVLLHHVMGTAGGQRGIWGYVRGGMGQLSEAIAASARGVGVEIRMEAPVERIVESGGRVAGVQLADGELLESRVVASSVDARTTFLRLLPQAALPQEFRQAVAGIDYRSGSLKINVVLGEPPQFKSRPGAGLQPWHRGTIHVVDDMEAIERAYEDARRGAVSRRPILEVTMPTSLDDSLAPPGKHILNLFVQYAPYRLLGTNWDEQREAVGNRCLQLLGEYAPNVPGAVERMQVLAPPDLEERFGITGGNIMQGGMGLDQLFAMRPVPGWADHRTPLAGLYLCGAASHPGGGVMGTCGRNAAEAILRSRRI